MMKAQDGAIGEPVDSWLGLCPNWLFDNMPDAVVLAAADTGRIALWNPAAAELFGFTADEVLDTPLTDLVQPLEHASQWTAARTGAARRASIELFARRKNSTELRVELSLTPLQIAADGQGYVLALIRDTAERRQSQDALIENIVQRVTGEESAAAVRRLSVLAEASQLLDASLDYEATLQEVARVAVRTLADWCIVHLLEQDGTIRWLAVAHGDPAKEAVARELQARYPATEGVARVLRTGVSEVYNSGDGDQSPDLQRTARARDADHLRMLRELDSRSVMIVPLTARGRMLGVMSVISTRPDRRYDRTDLTIAEELARRCGQAVDNARLYKEAQAAVEARDRFVSIASHELRTPIARVKGYAEMVLAAHTDGDLTDEMLERSLSRINHASDRLTVLVRDLLDVSKMRTGNLPMRMRPLNFVDLVRDVVGRYQEQLKLSGAGGHLLLNIVGSPRPLTGDPDRLDQVLTNLLDNALKYSPDTAELMVSVQSKARGVLFELQDHGIGLPPQAVGRIFEPFARAENAEQRQITGMGLGLYICRNIVEQHDGRIWARSDGEGKGTLMSLWLPVRAGQSLAQAAAA